MTICINKSFVNYFLLLAVESVQFLPYLIPMPLVPTKLRNTFFSLISFPPIEVKPAILVFLSLEGTVKKYLLLLLLCFILKKQYINPLYYYIYYIHQPIFFGQYSMILGNMKLFLRMKKHIWGKICSDLVQFLIFIWPI